MTRSDEARRAVAEAISLADNSQRERDKARRTVARAMMTADGPAARWQREVGAYFNDYLRFMGLALDPIPWDELAEDDE